MNSSFLALSYAVQAMLAIGLFGLLFFRFFGVRETLRALGLLSIGSIAFYLTLEALTMQGQPWIFVLPQAYGMSMGVHVTAMMAFTYLSALERPTELQRKILWRLPLIGALLGYMLGNGGTLYFFAAGQITVGIILFPFINTHRWHMRLWIKSLVLLSLYFVSFYKFIWLSPILLCAWLLCLGQFIEGFLVKQVWREGMFIEEVKHAT